MTKEDLGNKLNEMYSNSETGEKVAMIHLFGIRYANDIKKSKASFKEIANLACIQPSFATEISKGAKLAKYVKIIDNV